jgi:hypothetical protein
MIKPTGPTEFRDVSIVSDSFPVAEIEERILSVRTVGQGHPMTRTETNETLREFNRDPRGFWVGLVGILLLGTWTCLVLIEKRHPPKGGFTAVSSQAKSDSSPTADTVTHSTTADLSANKSSGSVTSVKSPLDGPKPTERFSKQNLVWTEITGGSTPSPVLVLSPKIGPLSDQVNQRESLSYQPNSVRTFRRKAPYQSHKSTGQLGVAEAKRRLLELWHRSLAKGEAPKSWAIFSRQNKSKKTVSTARKKEP